MNETKETVLPTATVGQATYNTEASESNMEQIRNTVRALRSEAELLEADPVEMARREKEWTEFKEVVRDMVEDIHIKQEPHLEYILLNTIHKFTIEVLSETLTESYQKEIIRRVLTTL